MRHELYDTHLSTNDISNALNVGHAIQPKCPFVSPMRLELFEPHTLSLVLLKNASRPIVVELYLCVIRSFENLGR